MDAETVPNGEARPCEEIILTYFEKDIYRNGSLRPSNSDDNVSLMDKDD